MSLVCAGVTAGIMMYHDVAGTAVRLTVVYTAVLYQVLVVPDRAVRANERCVEARAGRPT